MAEFPSDPKDARNDRVPGFTYAWMIPYLTRIGRRHGYAIAVHGSMSRDLDIVAVPWVEGASPPEELIEEIARLTDGRIVEANAGSERPHGRRSWNIVFDGAWHFLDISVTPVVAPEPERSGVTMIAFCRCPGAVEEHGPAGCEEPDHEVHAACPECGRAWRFYRRVD